MNSIKKIFPIAIVIVVWMTLNAFSQSPSTFTVIKVSGSVYSAALNRPVKRGDELTASDKLKFDSQKAYMHVINPAIGLKTVRGLADDSPRELMGLLQTFVTNKSSKLSRGAASTAIEKIRHELAYPKMLILGDGKFSVPTEEIPLTSPSGIKASYSINGNEVDRVISDETGFNLGKNFVFDNDLSQPLPEIAIIYYEDVNDRFFSAVEMIGELTPYYTDEESLKKELEVLIGILKLAGGDTESIESNLVTYLTTEYEAPIIPNLRDWLSATKLLTY